MDYKVLYRKYRPNDFNEIIGQEHIKNILINSIKNNKIAHAYIFTGPRGTGKTSTAKIFAKTLNCLNNSNGISCNTCSNCMDFKNNPDIIELDAASNNGVDNIREIIENLEIAPAYSKYKIYIIDEVHMLSTSAWNAFLKTLEEPPKNVIFILATTDIQKVPITVLSRCQRFDFTRIDRNLILDNLIRICDIENIEYEQDALEEVAYLSDGCMRDALSILDQLSKVSNMIDLNTIKSSYGVINNDDIDKIYFSILNNDLDSLEKLLSSVKESGVDIKILIDKMLENFINKAVDFKKKNLSNNAFNQLKKLIESLNQLYFKIGISGNGYLLLNLELISFINNDENNLSSREIKQITDNSKTIISVDNLLEKKIDYYKICDDFIKIRINNCFVNANKDYKNNFYDNWLSFKKCIEDNMKKEFFSLIKAVPMVCSNEYTVFVVDSQSLKLIGNSKLRDLENFYNSINKTNYKFVFITKNEWNDFLKTYDKSKKCEFISEEEFINNIDNSYSLAEDTFGNDNINIE